MKRRDMVRALLTPEPPAEAPSAPVAENDLPTTSSPAPAAARVPSTAIRAMGLEIGRLAHEAREAALLREQLADGPRVVELDPAALEASFVTDRLARTEDPEFQALVESIRAAGQLVPILVRPHPARPGRFQVAYGHRRWQAALALGRPVKAIVRDLADGELVLAQGKENAERRNLSFIERALFAAELQARGFDRATIMAALGVHAAELTRLLAVAAAVPSAIVSAIGPAPKAGRPRWMELAGALATPEAAARVAAEIERPAFRRLGSDARFALLLACLRRAGEDQHADQGNHSHLPEPVRDGRGRAVLWIDRSGPTLRLVLDQHAPPGLGEFLIARLPKLLERFERERAGRE